MSRSSNRKSQILGLLAAGLLLAFRFIANTVWTTKEVEAILDGSIDS